MYYGMVATGCNIYVTVVIDITERHPSKQKKWQCTCRLLGTSRLKEDAMWQM
jgi:hypothetical protein